MLAKAKKEWHGTYHPQYGLIEPDKEYEADLKAKMFEGDKVKAKRKSEVAE